MQFALSTTQPYLIYPATGEVATIVNKDPTNSILIGPELGLFTADPENSVVDPLASVVVDGSYAVWGIALGGTPTVSIMQGVQNWTPAIAELSVLFQQAGVPPIDNPQAIVNGILFNQTVTAGSTFTSPRLTVGKYQSLVGTIFAQETTGGGFGTNPYMRIKLAWSLQADNFDPLITENWVGAVGPFSFTTNYRHDFLTPCFGDTLTMSFINYDSKDIVLTYGLFGSYRTRSRSQLRGRYPDDDSAEATGMGSDNILYNASLASLAPGASSTPALIQLFEGPVSINGSFPGESAVGALQVKILPQPQSVLGSPTLILTSKVIPGILESTSMILPRRVCTVQLFNNGQTTITSPTVFIVGEVQPE